MILDKPLLIIYFSWNDSQHSGSRHGTQKSGHQGIRQIANTTNITKGSEMKTIPGAGPTSTTLCPPDYCRYSCDFYPHAARS